MEENNATKATVEKIYRHDPPPYVTIPHSKFSIVEDGNECTRLYHFTVMEPGEFGFFVLEDYSDGPPSTRLHPTILDSLQPPTSAENLEQENEDAENPLSEVTSEIEAGKSDLEKPVAGRPTSETAL
ncbi:hypothetical protein BU16DRAFT_557441 [Lophium mytilinum]|uniref:Uncharacterized protein n=1 Tax=Lophium mytilinum TaxID=390894 RepID=A0A6A6R6I9_9PEZI|nr:hypothetical protein BU16DRAFT_557441 [Lophium mytilinum]